MQRRAFVGALYIFFSVAILAVNKTLFNRFEFRFMALLFAIQSTGGLLFTMLLHFTKFIKLVPLQSITALKPIIPLALAYTFNVFLSLEALGRVDIPLFSALRRTVVIFVLLFDYLLTNTIPSRNAGKGLALLTAGTLCACLENFRGDSVSIAVACISNIATALYILLIKRKNVELKLDPMDLYLQTTIVCLPIIYLYTILSNELNSFLWAGYIHRDNPTLYFYLSISILLAFGLNYVIYLNTVTNSPLSQCVTAQIKDCLILLVGLCMISEKTMKPITALGLVCSLAGGVWYSFVTLREKYTLPLSDKSLLRSHSPLSMEKV